MTTAEIKKAKRDWLVLKAEIRVRIEEGTPSRYVIGGEFSRDRILFTRMPVAISASAFRQVYGTPGL